MKKKVYKRHAYRCRVCAKPIEIGEIMEWEKGKGGTHAACVGKPTVTRYWPRKLRP